jgi:competence protein ComEC
MVVSDWVATWSGSASRLPLLGAGPAVLLALAAALLCLSASALRLAALPFMFAAVFMPAPTEPLLRVDERGSNVGLATDQGWVPAVAKGASFSVRRWMEDDGDMATVAVAARRPGWRCDAKLCQTNSRGVEIAYLRRAAEAERRCPKADVLVAEFPLRNRCRGKMGTIDRFAVWREGAHDIHLSEGEIRVLTVRAAQGERPWTYESRARAMLSRKSP